METSSFAHLYAAAASPHSLARAYDELLSELFANPQWQNGPLELRRILWTQGREARAADPGAFGSAGLYLWGVEDRPIYVGITRSSFKKRFSRYIWGRRSQCELAKAFEVALVANGIDGFSSDVRDWYKRSFGGSHVRLRGAVRFAREGIAGIWFELLPHDDPDEIEILERALVPVAEAWNCERGIRPLLNVEFNHPRRG